MAKEIGLSEIGDYVKALHCDIRWAIIEILREEPLSSEEIRKRIVSGSEQLETLLKNRHNPDCQGNCKCGFKERFKKTALYYHLSALEDVGIIKLSNYKPSKHKKAPEKVWKLNMEKLTIKFK
ncbi:MAG: hypothetical protein ACTSQD_07485 [Promethearchaeota archaeon]